MEIGLFAFLSPPFGRGGLEATYNDRLRLIGKCVVNFLLLNFFARCYGWSATSEYGLKIGDFVSTGAG